MCVADFSDSYFSTRHLLQYCLMNNLIEPSRLELQIRKNRQQRTIILLQKRRHYL